VDTPEDYKKWLKDKPTVVQEVKAANTPAPTTDKTTVDTSKTQNVVVATKVAMK
jgi:cytochrome c oxidase subunit 2